MTRLCMVVLVVAGCGGKVVFVGDADSDGGGGEGGRFVEPAATPCEALCAGTPGCPIPDDCLVNCQSNYLPGCEAETDAFYQCQVDSFDPASCSPDLCSGPLDVLLDCQDGN